MIVLKGVLNNKYNLTACPYAYYNKDHKHSSTLYGLLKSAEKTESKKEPNKPAARKPTTKKAAKKTPAQKECDDLPASYNELKKSYPDHLLLFRCGDFYECYKEDAEKAVKVLGIVRVQRRNKKGNLIHVYAGFPYHALDTYLPKLIRAGHRVAICDKDEKVAERVKPAKSKKASTRS